MRKDNKDINEDEENDDSIKLAEAMLYGDNDCRVNYKTDDEDDDCGDEYKEDDEDEEVDDYGSRLMGSEGRGIKMTSLRVAAQQIQCKQQGRRRE